MEGLTLRPGTGANDENLADGGPVEPGAAVFEAGDPDIVAASEGNTTASRLRAKQAKLENRTKRFAIPPDDVWDGELVLVAKPARIQTSMSNVSLIADATADIEVLDEDTGEFVSITTVPDSKGELGWIGVANVMGYEGKMSIGDIILRVCSSREIAGAFADAIVAWIIGRRSQIEQALGE